MLRTANDERVVVMLNGRTERLVLETLALLAQDYPRLSGVGFERAVVGLSSRMRPGATPGVLGGFVALLSEMGVAGRLPRIRQGRRKAASRDELFIVALIGAAQRGDKGRTIEAAIALLDTGYVERVVRAAQSLGLRLAENGLVLCRIAASTFDYMAGYPAVGSASDSVPTPAPPPTRPPLRLLKSA